MSGATRLGEPLPHLLIVAYHYPPAGGVPVRRVLRVLRHLPRAGFRCSVLTADRPFDAYHPEDPDGVERLPPVEHCLRPPARAAIERVLSRAWRARGAAPAPVAPPAAGSTGEQTALLSRLRRFVQDYWLFPDPKRFWIRGAVNEAVALDRRDPIHAVWATGYPWSSFEVAARVGRALKVPVGLDYRDGWTSNPRRAWDTARQRRAEEALVGGAAFVTAATDWIAAELRQRVPDTPIVTMTNGYDPAEFPSEDRVTPDLDRCTFTYTGTFNDTWPPSAMDQSPYWLLAALERVPPEIRADLRVRLIGRVPEAVRTHVTQRKLAETVEIVGPVSHEAALVAQCAADYLLLIVADAPGSAGILTGKLVEYAGARRPIVGLVPEGEARRVIEREGLGAAIPPRDEAAIATALEQAVVEWRTSGRPGPAPEVGTLRADVQIQTLASKLRTALADSKSGR